MEPGHGYRCWWQCGRVGGAGGQDQQSGNNSSDNQRSDPLRDCLQPFDENLANNEGYEQKKGEQEAAAPFAPSYAAAAPTMPDDDDELVVDEEVVKEHDPDEQHGDRKIINLHDPKLPTEEEVRQHLMCHLPCRSWCHHCISIEDGLKITSRGSRSTIWTIAFPETRLVNG